jgi:hypothetical protein
MTGDQDIPEQSPAESNFKEPGEDEIDLNLIGSFPASDPPSWTLGIRRSNKVSIDRPPVSEP